MELQKVFISNLKFYRKQKNITQTDLSIQLDKSYNYINGIECGVSFPPPEVIQQIATVLNIRPMQLFDENASPENVITFDKKKFIDEVSNTLYTRLRADLRNELEDIIDKKIDG